MLRTKSHSSGKRTIARRTPRSPRRRRVRLDRAVHTSISDIHARYAPARANIGVNQAILAGGTAADRQAADGEADAQVEQRRGARPTLALEYASHTQTP